MFDEKYQELKESIAQIISVQQELQSQHDRLENELRGVNQQFQKAVLENPTADHSRIEYKIGEVSKQLGSLMMKLNVFPQKYPDESDIAKQIAEGKSDGLRGSALEVMALGISEIGTIQEKINNLVDVEIPALQQQAIKLATKTGNLEREKTNISEALKFVRLCIPDDPSSRFKARRSVEWPAIVIDEDETAAAFDSAR